VTWVIRKFMGGTAQLLSCSFVTKNASENVRKVRDTREIYGGVGRYRGGSFVTKSAGENVRKVTTRAS